MCVCVCEQNKLEKTVVENLCRSIVHEVVVRVRAPERPESPAELYITEEQLFQNKNPKVLDLLVTTSLTPYHMMII